MMLWPTQSSEALNQGEEVQAFLSAMTDDDLAKLMALHEMIQRGALPKWAEPIIDEIVERTEKRLAEKANEARSERLAVKGGSDLPALFAAQWRKADAAMRDTLRSLAQQLGIDLPMRRAKPPQARDRARSRSASAEAEISTPRTAQKRSRDPIERDKTEVQRKPKSDLTLIVDEDEGWEPCSSLFDAIHPENRGWHR